MNLLSQGKGLLTSGSTGGDDGACRPIVSASSGNRLALSRILKTIAPNRALNSLQMFNIGVLTVQASLGDNVDLDGGVATAVVDRAGVDLGDRHGDWCCGLEEEGVRKQEGGKVGEGIVKQRSQVGVRAGYIFGAQAK